MALYPRPEGRGFTALPDNRSVRFAHKPKALKDLKEKEGESENDPEESLPWNRKETMAAGA
jgi:hypothetical protein